MNKNKNYLEDKIALLALSQLIDDFDVMIYWKDDKGVYQGVNAHCLELTKKVTGKSKMLGLTDSEIFDEDTARQFMMHDNTVKLKRMTVEFEERIVCSNGIEIYQSTMKKPLLDSNDNYCGIIGITKRLNVIDLPDLTNIVLTRRESQILCFLCRGLSARKIGEKLNISHRTVENHVSNIRGKFLGDKIDTITTKINNIGLISTLEDIIL